MNRRDFLKMSGIGLAGIAGASIFKPKPPKKRKKKMTIAFDTNANSGDTGGVGVTFSWDHTLKTGVKFPGIVVGVSIFGAQTVSSISGTHSRTGNLKQFTFIREDHNGNYRSELWYINALFDFDPQDSTVTIDVNLSGATYACGGSTSYAFFGGVGVDGGANGTGTPASKAITTIRDNSMVMAALVTQTASGVTHAAGQYDLWNVPVASGGGVGTGMGARTDIVYPPASRTLQFDTITAGHSWAVSAVELLTYVSNPPAIR